MRCESGVHILRSDDADARTFDLNAAGAEPARKQAGLHHQVRWRIALAKARQGRAKRVQELHTIVMIAQSAINRSVDVTIRRCSINRRTRWLPERAWRCGGEGAVDALMSADRTPAARRRGVTARIRRSGGPSRRCGPAMIG
jgi:hypothetical protein